MSIMSPLREAERLNDRDWLAALFASALVANGKVPISKSEVIQCAYEYADQLIHKSTKATGGQST